MPSLTADVFCDKLMRTTVEAFHETATALERDLRRLRCGDSPLIAAWREGLSRAEDARARMSPKDRIALERIEAAAADGANRYERRVMEHVTLYGGLADWPLLRQLLDERFR